VTAAPAASWFEQTWLDLVFGARTQLKTPASTTALVLILALGITAASLSFTVTNSLFLNPLPVDRPAQLVRIAVGEPVAVLSYADRDTPDQRPALRRGLARPDGLRARARGPASRLRRRSVDPGASRDSGRSRGFALPVATMATNRMVGGGW
jgi:hypothetical protein